MIIDEYEYNGYHIEIHQHPIYNDFEYVIKENNEVKFTNEYLFKNIDDAHNNAKLTIDTHQNK